MFIEYFKQLRIAIPLLMEEHDIPGFMVALTDGENTLFSENFGFSDSSKTMPITKTTQFSVQSISKTYTAFGFMLAVQDGKVSLDEPIKKYIPQFQIKQENGIDYSAKITFRQLLKHRSGLVRNAPVVYSSFEDHINSINETYLMFKPNEGFAYSNLGFDLVAYSLGKIYNISFTEYAEKMIFEPLGMVNSKFDQQATPMLGSSGMYSCPNDMLHFINCVINEGIHNKMQTIDNNLLRMIYERSENKEEWEYCLGVDTAIVHGNFVVHHNGGGNGFLTTQDIFPYDNFGMVALTNSDSHPNIHRQICRGASKDFSDMRATMKEDCEKISEKQSVFIGLYEGNLDDGKRKLAVVPRNGKLFCNGNELFAYTDNSFFTESDDCIEFSNGTIKYNNITMTRCAV